MHAAARCRVLVHLGREFNALSPWPGLTGRARADHRFAKVCSMLSHARWESVKPLSVLPVNALEDDRFFYEAGHVHSRGSAK